jgi:hypothetical protein
MTRYIVVWNPAFEFGKSRMEIVNSLKDSWTRTGSSHLCTRRSLELLTTTNEDLFSRFNAWLLATWGKSMPKRALSVVTISDPEWDLHEEKWKASHAALDMGNKVGQGKPQFCLLTFEGDLAQKRC